MEKKIKERKEEISLKKRKIKGSKCTQRKKERKKERYFKEN